MSNHVGFDEHKLIQRLKHYLPSQAPLKDFIHHNTLHAFQHKKFHKALQQASCIFGYRVYLSLDEYRERYRSGRINPAVLRRVISEKKGADQLLVWTDKLLHQPHNSSIEQRLGRLRDSWKANYKINVDKEVHSFLFRLIGTYLDQGISGWRFPVNKLGFLSSVRDLERHNLTSIFRSTRARELLLHSHCSIERLLHLLVGDECLFEQYLFDQQFAHPGWSGMVAVLEDQPGSLLDKRTVSLRDFIILELLLEIDALDHKSGQHWEPLAKKPGVTAINIFDPVAYSEYFDVLSLWQNAFEWSYYDQVLKGLQMHPENDGAVVPESFQAIFCIDDRECSLRRYLEKFDPGCSTFASAGFFNVEFYFQPEHGKFHTKVCPAPLQPQYLVKETEAGIRHKKDAHFSNHSHGLAGGWLISQTMGFWSAIKLARSIFKPSETAAMVSAFTHMDKQGKLSVEARPDEHKIQELQVGFTVTEMADRMEGLLKSIGMLRFAPLVYLVGHGASSVNNTHYAGYDCGACSGRPGSVNARVAAYMANHTGVREILKQRGISIPAETHFVGGLHDTTRDEIEFFDTDKLSAENLSRHEEYLKLFKKALSYNAKERSRRFLLMNTKDVAEKVHKKVRLRAMSLFEPRPEWNHATNALCVVGRRAGNKHLFLDRRAFLNSYDYRLDIDGKYLLNILKAVAPVCGGINLEYYFSRVDNYRLGAGTKLPHNVMGLIGVANGMDGDLRPGLPRQMINIHDPLRLMVIVEQDPAVVLKTIQLHAPTYEWFQNEWVHLAVTDPADGSLYYFKNEAFVPYEPLCEAVPTLDHVETLIESNEDNMPVYLIHP